MVAMYEHYRPESGAQEPGPPSSIPSPPTVFSPEDSNYGKDPLCDGSLENVFGPTYLLHSKERKFCSSRCTSEMHRSVGLNTAPGVAGIATIDEPNGENMSVGLLRAIDYDH
jgi:hypothetical protein